MQIVTIPWFFDYLRWVFLYDWQICISLRWMKRNPTWCYMQYINLKFRTKYLSVWPVCTAADSDVWVTSCSSLLSAVELFSGDRPLQTAPSAAYYNPKHTQMWYCDVLRCMEIVTVRACLSPVLWWDLHIELERFHPTPSATSHSKLDTLKDKQTIRHGLL